jgi:hypothetical protein
MLWNTAIAFAVLWAIGLATSHVLGGFIHVLIAVAVALLLVQIIRDRFYQASG